MRLKILCDEESWKKLSFWVEVNKSLGKLIKSHKRYAIVSNQPILR